MEISSYLLAWTVVAHRRRRRRQREARIPGRRPPQQRCRGIGRPHLQPGRRDQAPPTVTNRCAAAAAAAAHARRLPSCLTPAVYSGAGAAAVLAEKRAAAKLYPRTVDTEKQKLYASFQLQDLMGLAESRRVKCAATLPPPIRSSLAHALAVI